MKFTLNEREVIDKIMLATEVCGSDQDIRLTILQDKIRLFSNDYSLDFFCDLPCYNVVYEQGEEPKNILVSSKQIFSIVKDLKDGIEFFTKEKEKDYDDDNSEESIYELHYYSPIENEKGFIDVIVEDDFESQDTEFEGFFEIGKNIFCDMVDRTVFAVSISDTRSFLKGVRILEGYTEIDDNKAKKLALIGSDGVRLSMVSKEIDNLPDFKPITVPTKSIKLFRKVIEKSEHKEISLKIQEDNMSLKVDDILISSGIIDEYYPDYRKIIGKEFDTTIKIDKSNLISALIRFSKTADKKEKRVLFTLYNDKLEIKSSEEGKMVQREIDCVISSDTDKIEFNINYQFVLDILRVLKTETISIRLKSNTNEAIAFEEDPQNSDFHMVMPLRY